MMGNSSFNRKILVFLMPILIISNTATAVCPQTSKASYTAVLKRATKDALPGVGYYYQKADCIIIIAKGHSDIVLETKIQATDRFRIVGISKLFVAISSLKLAKSGVFKLDDSIQRSLPCNINLFRTSM